MQRDDLVLIAGDPGVSEPTWFQITHVFTDGTMTVTPCPPPSQNPDLAYGTSGEDKPVPVSPDDSRGT